jgi:CubicO group peptidase (beta-lactamase class C family)
MSHIHRKNFRAQHIRSALFTLVLLLSLFMPTLLTAPAQAMHTTPPPPAPSGLSDPRELGAFLDRVIGAQLREDHIAGATISVVKDGRLFFVKGYGSADLQTSTPVSAQTTLFRIGSVSKLFTATAVLQLVEQDKLNLHADVNTYLKTFHLPATYPEPITLAHLLTHTAGFEDRETGLYPLTTSDLEPLGRWLAEHIPARVRPPGELTAYSNYGYALAGYIVEQVSGVPFEQYIGQHLFQPLGMRESTFRQPLPASLSADLSQGYAYSNGVYHPSPFDVVQGVPEGAMSATATDMANFMIALLQNGRFGTERILQAAMAKEMLTQQFTNDPRVPGMAYGFPEGNLNSQHLLVHDGFVPPAFSSLLALLPEHHVGLFVSYNSAGGLSALGTLLQAFLDHYFPAPKETLPPPPAGFAERISQVSGTYWTTRRSYTTWEKLLVLGTGVSVSDGGNGRLVIGHTPFVEVAPWVFHQVDGQETVVFRADSGGMLMLRSGDPVDAFIKVAWYDVPTLHLALGVSCMLLFLSALLLGPLGFVRRAMRRGARSKLDSRKADHATAQTPPQTKQRKPPLSRWGLLSVLTSWLAGVLCALNMLFLIGLGLFLIGQVTVSKGSYLLGVPPLLTTLFALALVSMFLTVGVVVGSILAWWGRFWSVGRRVHYTLVALAALACAWELVYWNLLGFRA